MIYLSLRYHKRENTLCIGTSARYTDAGMDVRLEAVEMEVVSLEPFVCPRCNHFHYYKKATRRLGATMNGENQPIHIKMKLLQNEYLLNWTMSTRGRKRLSETMPSCTQPPRFPLSEAFSKAKILYRNLVQR